ncbi:MAG: CPBP family glutamic-type intramembrane protease [Pseudomonadota bacterium]
MFLFRSPSLADWRGFALALIGFAALAMPFGLATGLYDWSPVPLTGQVIGFAAYLFFVPAVLEELAFRAPLLWWQERRGRVPNWAIIVSLIVFVVWHPANTYLFMPEARALFSDWRFLTVAGTLGAVATALTLTTRSLWPPIVFHWLVVLGWKTLLGAPDFV